MPDRGSARRSPRSPSSGFAVSEMARAVVLCPLCRDGGRPVLLEAEIEREGELLVVVDLRGCRHANRFGNLERLTVDEEWRLIEAALGAYDATPTTKAAAG